MMREVYKVANILVCDDDKDIVEAIDIYLTQEGYEVLKAYDGDEAIKVLKRNEVDLLIMDVMMPRLDGIRATLKIRENMSLPIIILSAKSEDTDKILGLNIGADDYIVKPFAMEELLARLRIWSRRTVSLEDPGELCFGDLSYRPSVRQLSGPAGKEVLPKRLAQLIELLLRNAEVPITRNVIFNRIWGPDAEVTDAVIDTYIHLTRQRLAHLQSAVKIQNSRGTGYQLSYEREL